MRGLGSAQSRKRERPWRPSGGQRRRRMTVEGRGVRTGSVPHHKPRSGGQTRQTPVGVLIAAAGLAVAALAGLISVGVYLSRDKSAMSPGPQTVTISASSAATGPADGADAQFLSTLDSYGITDNGKAAIRQRLQGRSGLSIPSSKAYFQLFSHPQTGPVTLPYSARLQIRCPFGHTFIIPLLASRTWSTRSSHFTGASSSPSCHSARRRQPRTAV